METWTEEHLAELEEAISTGARRIKFSDKDVELRSLDEMVRTRDMLRRQLFPSQVRPVARPSTFKRGL